MDLECRSRSLIWRERSSASTTQPGMQDPVLLNELARCRHLLPDFDCYMKETHERPAYHRLSKPACAHPGLHHCLSVSTGYCTRRGFVRKPDSSTTFSFHHAVRCERGAHSRDAV